MTIKKSINLNNERGERIKYIRKELLSLSRNELTRRFNIPTGTIQNWEDARHGGLTEKGAIKFTEILASIGIKCEVEWLMYGLGKQPLQRHEIKSQISTINEKVSNKSIIDQISDELSLFYMHSPFSIDMIVPDDAMEPMFLRGDVIAGKRTTSGEIKQLIKQICIFQTFTGLVLARKIMPGKREGYYDLIAINRDSALTDIDYFDELIITAAPVQWIRRK